MAQDRLLPPDEALAIVEQVVQRLPVEHVRLTEAAERVLAEPVVAPHDVPPFPAATMDGFAVIHDDASPWREVIGEVYAGQAEALEVTPGTAVRIMTGAPVPRGADAVVPIERVELRDDHIILHDVTLRPGENIRPIGADVHAGDRVLPAGTVLGPAELGVLASLGIGTVAVVRRPRVSVLTTGDELVEPGEPLRPGQIWDSNRLVLATAAQRAGAELVWAGRAPDEPEALRTVLEQRLAESDILLTTGGVSVGDRDFVRDVLGEIGTVYFRRLFMKPGKPLHFATVGNCVVFGLPGNPVSALVGFDIFVRTAIRRMLGQEPARPQTVLVTLDQPVQTSDRIEYQRGIVWVGADGRLYGRNTGNQQSSRLASFVGANAYLVIPPREGPYAPGERVEAIVWGALRSGPPVP